MRAKMGRAQGSSLSEVLPGFQFGETHSGIVDAARERVWRALVALRWSDLRVGRLLMALRGLGAPARRHTILDLFTERAGAVLVEQPPAEVLFVMVGKPWSPVPRHADVSTVHEVRSFGAPGWLKYGMEWRLYDLGDGRTLVETRTLCEATDAGARRAFGIYWTLIRLGSGAIRHDMIAALRRNTA